MVEAASTQCESLKYTQFANCHPVEERADGLVVVATAAAPYNPLYYAVVGTAAEPFDAVAADYVMRGVSALICALAIALVGVLPRADARRAVDPARVHGLDDARCSSTPRRCRPRTRWRSSPRCMTWCALLAVASGRLEPRWERRLVWLAGAAAVATVVPRTLGPMWLAVVGLVLAVFVGRRRLAEVVRAHTVPVVTCLALVVLATLGSAAWSAYRPVRASPRTSRRPRCPWTRSRRCSPSCGRCRSSAPSRSAGARLRWASTCSTCWPWCRSSSPAYGVPPVASGWPILGAVALTILLPIGLTLATAASQGADLAGALPAAARRRHPADVRPGARPAASRPARVRRRRRLRPRRHRCAGLVGGARPGARGRPDRRARTRPRVGHPAPRAARGD